MSSTTTDRNITSLVACPLVPRLQGPDKGLRLSWPHAGDRRRAVVGKSPSTAHPNPHVYDARFVHVSKHDMEMYYHLARTGPDGGSRPEVDILMPLKDLDIEIEQHELFHYFQRSASKCLATFGHDPTELGNVLIRAALASNTAMSCKAMLLSMLALSALHGHGLYEQAALLKISALNTLVAASKSNFSTAEAFQHVATNMLLCSFEIHLSSCTSGEWTCYLRGAKDVIQAAGLDKLYQSSDMAVLLDWVYYHDVLARFSLRHWHKESTAHLGLSSTPGSTRAGASHATSPALALIELLSEVCDAVPAKLTAMKSAEDIDDHKSFLTILDWKIRSMELPLATSTVGSTTEVYRLAMLVYLRRASKGLLKQGVETQELTEKAFSILARLGSCDRQFPVFILGYEARTDEQRAIILDLITRTEKRASSRSFNHLRMLLQATWAQNDLSGGDADYYDKLSYIISCCVITPSFV